jgi:predicted acyltransferase
MSGEPGHGKRIDSLDAARGCAILLMIFVNFVAQYTVIPGWTKHAVGDGFTYVDAIAPTFIFIMGISAALSFARRREAKGVRGTVLHALGRYGLLFLFGSIGTAAVYAAFGYLEWNIFQTLAIAGLFSFPFLFIRSPWLRIASSLLAVGLYQLALSLFLNGAVFAAAPPVPFLPSFVQSLALTAICIFGSGLGERIGRGKTAAAAGITCAFSLALGACLWLLVPPNRTMGSITYLLLGLGAAAGCLLLFFAVERLFRLKRVPLLSTLGRNSLVIFMIASVLSKLLNAFIPEDTDPLKVLAAAALLEAFCLSVAEILDRRGIYVKL